MIKYLSDLSHDYDQEPEAPLPPPPHHLLYTPLTGEPSPLLYTFMTSSPT